jgi:uncharacterized protein with von Willebrand factor type A (vWA) domain
MMEALKFTISDFLLRQPNANPQDTLKYFVGELEIEKHLEIISQEVGRTVALQQKLRPFILKKKELDEKMKEVMQVIELEVATTYPPRQGSDKEREALRSKLKKENSNYQVLDGEYREVTEKIFEIELDLDQVQLQGKNSRRITEIFESIISFLSHHTK